MISGDDIDEMIYIIVAAPIISLIFLVFALRKKARRNPAVWSMLVVYWAASLCLFLNSRELQTTARWLRRSNDYKAQLMAQPAPTNGELRHIEWDGWGFAGMDTVRYLVFDPNDVLASAAASHSSGKFSGIPCAVYRVNRLAGHYYIAWFYTDTEWNACS